MLKQLQAAIPIAKVMQMLTENNYIHVYSGIPEDAVPLRWFINQESNTLHIVYQDETNGVLIESGVIPPYPLHHYPGMDWPAYDEPEHIMKLALTILSKQQASEVWDQETAPIDLTSRSMSDLNSMLADLARYQSGGSKLAEAIAVEIHRRKDVTEDPDTPTDQSAEE